MKFCYDKLWRTLSDRGISKRALSRETGICLASIARLTKNSNVNTGILLRICSYLHCNIGDIMEFVPDNHKI